MDEQKVIRAIQFALQKHAGQERKASGMPYIVHLHGTALLMRAFKKSKNITDLMCAAYLHDVLEDTDCTEAELERKFGPLVASIVKEVTNDEDAIRLAGGKVAYLSNKLKTCSSYALTLKLCDRLDNVSSNPTPKTIHETIDILHNLIEHRKLSKTQTHIVHRIAQVVDDPFLKGNT